MLELFLNIIERLLYRQSEREREREGGGGGGGGGRADKSKNRSKKREHTNYHHLPEMLISFKHSNI